MSLRDAAAAAHAEEKERAAAEAAAERDAREAAAREVLLPVLEGSTSDLALEYIDIEIVVFCSADGVLLAVSKDDSVRVVSEVDGAYTYGPVVKSLAEIGAVLTGEV